MMMNTQMKPFNELVLLGLLAALATLSLFVIPGVDGIKCWVCNSYITPTCGDPFRNGSGTIALVDCEQKRLPHLGNAKPALCRKISQKIEDSHRIVRDCGWLDENGFLVATIEDEAAAAAAAASSDPSSLKDTSGVRPDPSARQGECFRRSGTFSVQTEYCSCYQDGCNSAPPVRSGHPLVLLLLLLISIMSVMLIH